MTARNRHRPTLSVILPAYDEAEAIQATAVRAVAAIARLERAGDILRGEVIVVDDGSRDQTAVRAGAVAGVSVVSYPGNRGYGRAIETGFAVAAGELLAFMDADGTCDPEFLGDLVRELQSTDADVVLGSRLHRESRMPAVRRLGNRLYAQLLSLMSGERVGDCASGMRVVRRGVLARVAPLPAGMSYTPAMTAKCVMDPMITIRELPMPYAERVGKSKLDVVGDGLTFLRTILITGMFYSPLRVFGGGGLLAVVPLTAAAAILGVGGHEGWSMLVAGSAILIGGVASAVGLTFHFFSQRVLPDWPRLAVEASIERTFRVPNALLMATTSTLLGFAAIATGRPDGVSWWLVTGLGLWFAASLLVLVAAGRAILGELGQYDLRDEPPDLLAGTTVTGGDRDLGVPAESEPSVATGS